MGKKESKILKAKCRITGKKFCVELKENSGTQEIVNFIPVSEEEYSILQSEARQSQFVTAKTLIPCRVCGNRILGKCDCTRGSACSLGADYDFNCVYCSELEIDYSLSRGKGPYSQWAGVSNIPDAIKDRYGNPSGSQYDLAQDGAFKNYTIILLNLCSEWCDFTKPQIALEKNGFRIKEYKTVPDLMSLQQDMRIPNSQLWVISNSTQRLDDSLISEIINYFNMGHGIYIWGDNSPFFADANRIIRPLFGTELTGDRPGRKVLGIQQLDGQPGIIANHLITTGLVNFYEGITIAELQSPGGLQPLIYGSECQILAAFYDREQKRALVDGGFTRLYCDWDSAGTDRYVVNAAAWLANIERFGYSEG